MTPVPKSTDSGNDEPSSHWRLWDVGLMTRKQVPGPSVAVENRVMRAESVLVMEKLKGHVTSLVEGVP